MDVDVKEQQERLFKLTKQELIDLVRANKADLWLENKKLKVALRKAAEMVNKTYCPYDLTGETDFCNCGSDCTFEDGVQCWIDYWMEDIRGK